MIETGSEPASLSVCKGKKAEDGSAGPIHTLPDVTTNIDRAAVFLNNGLLTHKPFPDLYPQR